MPFKWEISIKKTNQAPALVIIIFGPKKETLPDQISMNLNGILPYSAAKQRKFAA